MPYIEIENDEDHGPQPTRTQSRGQFAGAADALKAVPVSRRWHVGDLIRHPSYGQCLILFKDVWWNSFYNMIAENGYQFVMSEPNGYSHNTGLEYTFLHQTQVEEDYKNGLFTPYFEIL